MSDSSDDGARSAPRQLRRATKAAAAAAAGEERDGGVAHDTATAAAPPSTSTLMTELDASRKTTTSSPAFAALPLSSGGKLSKKRLKKMKKKYKKRGVIYISRIPPNMRPQKVRYLLSEYGEVGRVYLAAEDAAVRRGKRQNATDTAAGSSSNNNSSKKKLAARTPKRFTEGWVEFEDKADAKKVALALNGQPVGGKPRSNHRHDLWCLKYLSRFKWDDLTEEIAAQNAARESRLAAEASAAARERDFYLSKVDEARGREAMAKRRQAKAEKEGGVPVDAPAVPAPPMRTFRQNRVVKGEEEAGPAAAARGKTAAGSAGSGGGGGGGGGLSKATLALIAGRD